MPADSLLDELAARIVDASSPSEDVLVLAHRHFVETVAVVLSGARERVVQGALATMVDAPRNAGVRSLVTDRRLSPRDAAVCNGTAGHAHDYDDDEPYVIVGHPSVAIVAALMAFSDTRELSLEQALHGYIVGVETMSLLGAAVNPAHYNNGWHCTSTLGVFGATAACGRAMRLDKMQVANALAIAATFAGGLKENFGSDLKPLQVGLAAGNAIWACELSAAGVEGSATAVFGRMGFAGLLGSTDGVLGHDVCQRFAAPWAVQQPGVNVKVYPCCSSTHTALDAMLELRSVPGWTGDDIETVDVWIGADIPAILIHDIPTTGLQGKFSMRYCLAVALVNGRVTLEDFTDAAIANPIVLAALRRMRVHVDPALPRVSTGVTHRSRVRLTRIDGRQAEREVDVPIGSPSRPCSAEQLDRKALQCVSFVHGPDRASRTVCAMQAVGRSDQLALVLDAVHLDRS